VALENILNSLGDGNAESEQDFSRTFITTGDYRRVESNLRDLVLGGRGTGKSAICRKLETLETYPDADSKRIYWAAPLSSDSASWQSLERAANALSDPQSISRQWELTILLQCFEVVMNHLPRNVKKRQVVRQLDREITKLLDRDKMKSVSEGRLSYIVETAVEILQRLPFKFVVKAPFVPISVEVREPSDSHNEPQLSQPEREQRRIALIESMYGVLKEVIPSDTTVLVLIDKLDDDWKGRESQVTSLVELLSAIMRLHGNLIRTELRSAIRVVVFLRADIYEHLKQKGFDDATKFTQHELHLRWDIESLRSILDRRILAADQPEFESFRSLFSNERVGGRSLDQYLLTVAAPRPRDVIVFLRESIDNALNRMHERVSRTDVEDAESKYSYWRRQVIIEESRYSIPQLEEVLNSFVSRTPNYTPRELLRHLDIVKKEAAVSMTKPKIIDAMVEWGVIGVEGRDRRRRFVWDLPAGQWFGPDEAGGEPTGETWVIHQALWKALSVRKKRITEKTSPQ
jgi:hypothetical protein